MIKPRLEPLNWFGAGSEGWRRIRVGITGLAAIMLMIGLASAMFSRLTLDPQSPSYSQPANKADNAEPMADLGVAPGAATAPEEPRPTPRP